MDVALGTIKLILKSHQLLDLLIYPQFKNSNNHIHCTYACPQQGSSNLSGRGSNLSLHNAVSAISFSG